MTRMCRGSDAKDVESARHHDTTARRMIRVFNILSNKEALLITFLLLEVRGQTLILLLHRQENARKNAKP
jgi:hypothetical protein